MLERLSIHNVGGISRCELAFETGFTVITGESGAGKSSIVRAIELASGKRGQAAFIRAGEEEAGVDAVFHIEKKTGSKTDLCLPDLPSLGEERQPAEGVFFTKRTLSRSGRGRASIQGTQLPVALYASSVGRLIHIQSQFAQLELLDPGRQLVMVDSCGSEALHAVLRELRYIFEQARLKERELKDIAARRA